MALSVDFPPPSRHPGWAFHTIVALIFRLLNVSHDDPPSLVARTTQRTLDLAISSKPCFAVLPIAAVFGYEPALIVSICFSALDRRADRSNRPTLTCVLLELSVPDDNSAGGSRTTAAQRLRERLQTLFPRLTVTVLATVSSRVAGIMTFTNEINNLPANGLRSVPVVGAVYQMLPGTVSKTDIDVVDGGHTSIIHKLHALPLNASRPSSSKSEVLAFHATSHHDIRIIRFRVTVPKIVRGGIDDCVAHFAGCPPIAVFIVKVLLPRPAEG